IGPSGRERRACCDYLNQSRGLSLLPPGEDNDAQLFAQTRTLRIRQMDGLEISTDKLDLAAPASGILSLSHFHKVSRAEGPKRTDGMRRPVSAGCDTLPM